MIYISWFGSGGGEIMDQMLKMKQNIVFWHYVINLSGSDQFYKENPMHGYLSAGSMLLV